MDHSSSAANSQFPSPVIRISDYSSDGMKDPTQTVVYQGVTPRETTVDQGVTPRETTVDQDPQIQPPELECFETHSHSASRDSQQSSNILLPEYHQESGYLSQMDDESVHFEKNSTPVLTSSGPPRSMLTPVAEWNI